MDKGFVYYKLCGQCFRIPSKDNPNPKEFASQHVVVRFKNEHHAERSQLVNGFEDVHEHFQAGLPYGWVMSLNNFGLECQDVISEEEANKIGYIIV